MKAIAFALALPLVLALCACRDGDPDDTPPVGRATAGAASPAVVDEPVRPNDAPATAAVDGRPSARRAGVAPATPRGIERVRRLTDARRALDAAWAACDAAGDAGARCRDEAATHYADATRDLDVAGIAAEAVPPGVLAGHDELAVVQVTGTRG